MAPACALESRHFAWLFSQLSGLGEERKGKERKWPRFKLHNNSNNQE